MNNMQNNNSAPLVESAEDKLIKIKSLFDKGLIDESDYKKKKDEIISSM